MNDGLVTAAYGQGPSYYSRRRAKEYHGFGFGDSKLGLAYDVLITSRQQGTDTGRDTLLDHDGQLKEMRNAIRYARRPLTEEQKKRGLQSRDRSMNGEPSTRCLS